MAENDGELSFEPNQIITNGVYNTKNINSMCIWKKFIIMRVIAVKASWEPGWLEGTLNGKTGLVPKNYVEQLP